MTKHAKDIEHELEQTSVRKLMKGNNDEMKIFRKKK